MLIIRPLHYIIYYDNLLNMNKQGKITPLTISTPPQKKNWTLAQCGKGFHNNTVGKQSHQSSND